ncbi:MAG: hypothetical protein RMY29_021760 [Nostoc sp. CreGUA01]|nr:hypothetical protein [Nostoc sp. CreGUA01]
MILLSQLIIGEIYTAFFGFWAIANQQLPLEIVELLMLFALTTNNQHKKDVLR